MKKLAILFFLLLFVPSMTLAVDFMPTKLELAAPEVVQYDFDGSTLELPVTVTGTPARTFFLVFTKDKAEEIGEVQNGYLGWHYVNAIDTCLFVSGQFDFPQGANTITWDGKDDDGGTVPADDYTYYLWAYDYQSPKVKATHENITLGRTDIWVQETAEDGTPLANPFMVDKGVNQILCKKWVLGDDPDNDELLETCNFPAAETWQYRLPCNVCPVPGDHTMWYHQEHNEEAMAVAMRRYKWVPNDDGVMDTEWGTQINEDVRWPTGPVTDGNYIYSALSNVYLVNPYAPFEIIDLDGEYVDRFLMDWWVKPEEYYKETGGSPTLNGGPTSIMIRDSVVLLGGYFCLQQVVDPMKYLETGDVEDFTRWCNQNGDYLLDRCSEPDSTTPWACWGESAPYPNCFYLDENYFFMADPRGQGAVSLALFAPDGTGVGYFAYSGEVGDISNASGLFVANGSAFDGTYSEGLMETGGLGFIGQDSLKGTLTHKVSVADDSPAAFAVEQNSPNPANPTTTIGFTLPEAGSVTVDVFNVAGQRVDTLVNDFMDAGKHSVVWDGADVSSGVYFYTVTSGEFSKTMKMTLLK